MANRRASIWIYVKVGDRWRYVKPAVGKNNKLRPRYAVIGGIDTHVPKASYYLRYRDGSKIVWRKCSSAADANPLPEVDVVADAETLPFKKNMFDVCLAFLLTARYQTIKITAMTPTSQIANFVLGVGMSHPAIKLAITCGKRITRRTIKAAPQNSAMLNGLRFWH